MTISTDVTSWRDRATLTVDEYADIVRVDRRTAYAAVRAAATSRTGTAADNRVGGEPERTVT